MAWLSAETLGQLALAAAFGSAAGAKARSFAGFPDYLRTPFGRMAKPTAAAVIGIEAALAIGLVAAPGSQFVPLSAALWVVAVTAFLAWRLVPFDETTCRCWGVRRSPRALDFDNYPSTGDALTGILAPSWYGFRNGVLLLGIWLLLDTSGERLPPFSRWGALSAFAVCPAIVLVGTLASIVRRRRFLLLENHPAQAALASRLAPLVALSWYQGTSVKLTVVGMTPWQRQAVRDRPRGSTPHVSASPVARLA